MKKPNRKRLTAAVVDNLKPPKDGRMLVWDTSKDANGLYVKKYAKSHSYPTGRVRYACYQRVDARPRHFTLPAFLTSPSAAREYIQREILPKLAIGLDPISERRKRYAVEDGALTIGKYLDGAYAPLLKRDRRTGDVLVRRIRTHFTEVLEMRLDDADSAKVWLRGWVERRRSAGIKHATVVRDLNVLSGLYTQAIDDELAITNPVKPLMKPDKSTNVDPEHQGADRIRFLSDDEEQRLRAALDAREADIAARTHDRNAWRTSRRLRPLSGAPDAVKTVVLMALNTGMRRGEILGMRWDRVDLKAGQCTVPAGGSKTNKTRRVPLNSEVRSLLLEWSIRNARPESGRVFSGRGIRGGWEAVRETAGLQDFRFHDLRHHAASAMVSGGVDLYVVSQVLGHSSTQMTQKYAHLAPEHLASAVEVIGRKR